MKRRTRCVWDYFLARQKEFINPDYDESLDIGEGVLFPKGEGVRWWAQAWGRTDAEMNGPGRGTNLKDDVTKVKEERQTKADKEREEALRERLERVVRTTSPRKELQLFDGVGSSPARTVEDTPLEESPTRSRSSLPIEVLTAQESFIEVDPSEGQTDPATDGTVPPEVIEEAVNATAVESSDETSIGGSASIISSAVEDSGLSASEYVNDGPEIELDPLGGGVEMTSLPINNTSLRNNR